MIDLELLSDYQAWRDDNEGLDRDVTPIAYLAYRRALDNEDKLDRIMRLQLSAKLTASMETAPAELEGYYTMLWSALSEVIDIIGQETEHDRND